MFSRVFLYVSTCFDHLFGGFLGFSPLETDLKNDAFELASPFRKLPGSLRRAEEVSQLVMEMTQLTGRTAVEPH